MKSVTLILPNQLFKSCAEHATSNEVFLVEEYLYFRQFAFHRQKLIFHRASMRAFETFLTKKDFKVTYIESADDRSDIQALIPWFADQGYTKLLIYDPVDYWLSQRIQLACSINGLELNIRSNPSFLETTQSLEEWFVGRKNYFQTDYYIRQRKRFSILVDKAGAPTGGKWTFDADNRLKFPKNARPPQLVKTPQSKWYAAAKTSISQEFAANPGSIDSPLVYPIDHTQAGKWLDDFLENRFKDFGIYEDAIVSREHLLHHSLLSPLLNSGLLTPDQVIKKSIDCAEEFDIPLNSLEGFIRQILGWREFIRGVYSYRGRQQRTTNFWGWTRTMPKSFYTGTTGITPVDDAIQKLLSTGYNHHIERLMVLGNFMLLCEIHPDEVYQWFMEMYVDAYDWVMVPNVYGMSQFADGGLMCTKPYISGSNYILKMSDYPSKQPWAEVWDALFWRFMHRQRNFFLKNPRLGMLIKTFDKMDSSRKKELLTRADRFLEKI